MRGFDTPVYKIDLILYIVFIAYITLYYFLIIIILKKKEQYIEIGRSI